jgi:hypothetical protein
MGLRTPRAPRHGSSSYNSPILCRSDEHPEENNLMDPRRHLCWAGLRKYTYVDHDGRYHFQRPTKS